MLCVISILYAEHRRSLRSSSFLSAFLSITMLFNIVRARSYLSRGRLDVFGALQVAIAILKFVLISLEELSKQSLFQPEHHWTSIGAEMRAGFWNRSLFVWVNKILLVGFKDVINVKDLPEIELEFSAERLCDKFQNKWQAGQSSRPKFSLLFILTFDSQQIVAVLPTNNEHEGSRLAIHRHHCAETLLHGLHFRAAFPNSHRCESGRSKRVVKEHHW